MMRVTKVDAAFVRLTIKSTMTTQPLRPRETSWTILRHQAGGGRNFLKSRISE